MITPTPIVRSLRLALGALPLLAFVGCVPYQTYETLKADRDKIKSAHDDLVVKYNRLIQDNLLLQKDGAMAAALRDTTKNQKQLIEDLTAKLTRLDRITPEIKNDLEGKHVEYEDGELIVRDDFLFNPGEAKLKNQGAIAPLDAVIEVLQKEYSDKIIHITGHTDTDPVKVTKSLWEDNHKLSFERAHTVMKYFVQHGIPETRILCHAMGPNQPRQGTDPNSKDGKAKNRRVAIGVGNMKI